MAGGLGFFLGGLSDSLNQGFQRQQTADYQQQELKLQAQGQQQAQQRFEMARNDKLAEELWNAIQATVDNARSVGHNEKEITPAIQGLVDQYRKFTTTIGYPGMADQKLAALWASPPSTEVEAAQAKAKEPPGQAELRSAQAEYYRRQAKFFAPDETGTGTVAPPGGNAFGPNTTINPGGSVEEIPPGARLPIGGMQTGGTKYINQPYSARQKAIIATQGASPEQFDFDAVMYAYGNTTVGQGYRAYKGINPVTVLRSRAAQYWMDKGLSPQEANAAMVEFGAMKHGANTAATIDARMTEAMAKAENTAKVVMPLAAKVDRTKYKDFNDFMVNVRKRTGNQDEIRLGIALETLATNYGASLGMGNSVITDTKLKQAEQMLEQGWDQGQLGAAVDQIMQELKREEAGTRQGMRQFLGNMSQEQNVGNAPGTAPDQGGVSGTSSGVRWSIEP